MTKKLVCVFWIFVVCLVTFSCKKLESTDQKGAGPLAYAPAKFADAIPDEYGTLIAVTQNPQTAGWFGLWFQRPDKSITAVFVNVDQGKIYEKTLTIPRR